MKTKVLAGPSVLTPLTLSIILTASLSSSVSYAESAAESGENTDPTTEVKVYGFILPKYNYASAGLKTFGTQTESAPTAAASQRGTANSNNIYSRATWQIGQSRFGIHLKRGASATGKVEVDFFNNNSPQPEYSLLAPRLRLATVSYKLSSALTLSAGQDWDIFNGGINPITYNPIGNFYQAGNAGFLRQQFVIAVGGEDIGLNFSFALGLPTKTDNGSTGTPVSDGINELQGIPTLAGNFTYRKHANELRGISLIAGRVIFAEGTVASDAHLAYGIAAFASDHFGSSQLKAKFYYGQNLNNINMLTLATAAGLNSRATAVDLTEMGGFISTWTPMTKRLGLLVSAGIGTVSNSSSLILATSGSVLTSNIKGSLGVDYQLIKNLNVFGEYSYFSSTYTETTGLIATTYAASLVEVGMKFDI